MEESEFEVVYVAENKIIAEMLKDLLEKEDILSFLKGSTIPYTDSVIMGSIGATEIRVRKEDADRAREIIDAFMRGESEDGDERGTYGDE